MLYGSKDARKTLVHQKRCVIIDAFLLERELGISVETWLN